MGVKMLLVSQDAIISPLKKAIKVPGKTPSNTAANNQGKANSKGRLGPKEGAANPGMGKAFATGNLIMNKLGDMRLAKNKVVANAH